MVHTASDSPPQDRAAIQNALVRGTLIGELPHKLLLGGYFVAFSVQVLGLSNGQISLFLSLAPLAVLLRYPMLDRIRGIPRIRLIRTNRMVQVLCLLALLVLPDRAITLPVLLALALVYVLASELMNSSVWTNYVSEVTARGERGRFLGRLRTWKQTSAMLFALAGVFLVGETMDRTEHRVLLVLALALLVNALFWYGRIPPTAPPEHQRASTGRGQFWRILRSSPLMRRPLALALIELSLAWPILTVYLVGVLHLPANLILLHTVAFMFGPMCSMVLWGRKADTAGIRKVYATFFGAALGLFPILLLVPDFAAVETGGTAWVVGVCAVLALAFLQGVLEAGTSIASSIYKAHHASEATGFHALNIMTLCGKVFGAALMGAGGLLLHGLVGDGPVAAEPLAGLFWVDPFKIFTICFATSCCLAGLWLARGIGQEVG